MEGIVKMTVQLDELAIKQAVADWLNKNGKYFSGSDWLAEDVTLSTEEYWGGHGMAETRKHRVKVEARK